MNTGFARKGSTMRVCARSRMNTGFADTSQSRTNTGFARETACFLGSQMKVPSKPHQYWVSGFGCPQTRSNTWLAKPHRHWICGIWGLWRGQGVWTPLAYGPSRDGEFQRPDKRAPAYFYTLSLLIFINSFFFYLFSCYHHINNKRENRQRLFYLYLFSLLVLFSRFALI